METNLNIKKPEYLDKPKETVSLTGVFIFLGLLFTLFTAFIIYLRFSSISPLSGIYFKENASLDAILPLQSQLKKSVSGSLELKITEREITSSLLINEESLPIKKPECKVKPEGIFISGKTSDKFWGMPLEVRATPQVSEGQLSFNIVEIKAWGVKAPTTISNNLNEPVKKFLSQILPDSDQIYIKDARTMQGFLLIEATKQ